MVFSSKLEVGQSDGDEGSDDQENDENDEQNAVDGVDPVAPHTCEYVVQLDVDSTEGKKPCHCHLRNGSPVPGQSWNFTRIFRRATRSLKLGFAVLSGDTAQHKQRRCNQRPNQNNDNNGAKGKGRSCTVRNRDRVEKAKR